jgi:hypothetical protein
MSDPRQSVDTSPMISILTFTRVHWRLKDLDPKKIKAPSLPGAFFLDRAQHLAGCALFYLGNVLLSHTLARAVPSGLKGLTSVFGMGTGGSPSLQSPKTYLNSPVRANPPQTFASIRVHLRLNSLLEY